MREGDLVLRAATAADLASDGVQRALDLVFAAAGGEGAGIEASTRGPADPVRIPDDAADGGRGRVAVPHGG